MIECCYKFPYVLCGFSRFDWIAVKGFAKANVLRELFVYDIVIIVASSRANIIYIPFVEVYTNKVFINNNG